MAEGRASRTGGGVSKPGVRRLPAWTRYCLPPLSVAAATPPTYALFMLLGAENFRVVSVFYFLAVLGSALFGGLGPGLLAVILSALVIGYFFFLPDGLLGLDAGDLVQLAAFAFVSSLIIFLVERNRRSELDARRSEEQLATTLRSIGDAVIATDANGYLRFMNSVAERLTGWTFGEAEGRPLAEVFHIINEQTRRKVESPVEKVLREGMTVGLANHTLLVTREGTEIPIDDSGAPVRGPSGEIEGVVLVFHDVTDVRRTEAERARLATQVTSERGRLRDLIGSVPGVVWEAWGQPDEEAQRIDFVSDYVERMLGYTVEEWLSTPNFWLHIVHEDDRERAARDAAEHFEAGGYAINRFRWVTKDGRALHVESHATVIVDEHGRPAGMRGVTLDVTEREQSGERLRRSESRYRALADAMPQIVWTARGDGFIDYYNRRWIEYTGRGHDETRGWRWQQVVHALDAERHIRAWATSIETGRELNIQARLRRHDGQYRWHLLRAEPSRGEEGEVKRWFGTATDIHDQKQTEEHLSLLADASGLLGSSLDYEKTLDRLAHLVVSGVADLCLIDLIGTDGAIRRVAAAHRDAACAPLMAELRRSPPAPVHDDDVKGIACVLRDGATLIIGEVTDEDLRSLTRGDEQVEAARHLGIRTLVSVPLIARGRNLGALTCGISTEGRTYTQDEIAFTEELANRAALAIDNARLYSEAQEANRSKDEFLATLSHELRTPLTPIIGWTHMIRSGRLPPHDAVHGMSIIEKNSESLSRLINDLLDMSSIMSGKMRIERTHVEVSAALNEAAETVRPQAEARNVRLEVESDGHRPVNVTGDRTRLVQVFWNLLNNAIKFSHEGGRVTVRLNSRDDAARIEIEDEGHGIESDFLPYIFERFRQADGSTTRQHGGLGIGLSLVKSFVEAHGGSVTAASDGTGSGSRFTVTLPLAEAPHADSDGGPHTTADVEPCAAEVCRILLIEDAPDTLDMLRIVFEARGYDTTACPDSEAALRAAHEERFDLIVSDIGLPNIDGYELIRRLRDLPHLKETPAVALTGYAAPKDAEAARAAGFDAHVPKPVDPSTLTGEIERLLRQHAARNDESQ